LQRVGAQRGEDKRPGEFKKDQNMIGGRRLSDARFIPPPPGETAQCISELEKYLNRDDKSGSSPLIDMALMHYQFETIHPFADGNGRVGRILISLMALSEGLLDVPSLYLSPELELRKDEYIDRMYWVSARGAWEEWFAFFFAIVRHSCARTIGTIDKVIALNEDYRARVTAAHRSANMLEIVDMLFESPAIHASDVTTKLSISDAAARKLLRNLCDLKIVEELSRLYPTIWLASEIISVSRPSARY
jgi:Fic family protein